MTVPMCEGQRHVFIVGRELCRCGQERSLALSPRETRISELVTKETWPTIGVAFVVCSDAVAVIAECARCRRRFEPMAVKIALWEQMGSPCSEAKKAQRYLADRLVEVVNANPCGCRDASIWKRQGTKSLLS